MRAAAPTLVLDTNAWLDLLVFRDAALDGLEAAVAAGVLRLAVDDRALAELGRVLRYPALGLDEATAAAVLARARALATRVDAVPAVALPRCRDPDDQPFLEIAAACGACVLVTRDAALLRLATRMRRDHGVAIVVPAAWRGALDQMSKR